jgi:hypothetical protein
MMSYGFYRLTIYVTTASSVFVFVLSLKLFMMFCIQILQKQDQSSLPNYSEVTGYILD